MWQFGFEIGSRHLAYRKAPVVEGENGVRGVVRKTHTDTVAPRGRTARSLATGALSFPATNFRR